MIITELKDKLETTAVVTSMTLMWSTGAVMLLCSLTGIRLSQLAGMVLALIAF